jgi:hypothetical protein
MWFGWRSSCLQRRQDPHVKVSKKHVREGKKREWDEKS